MQATAERGAWSGVRRRLKAAALAGARAQAYVLFTLVYYLFLGPAALVLRLVGADILERRRPAKSGWTPRPPRDARELLEKGG